MRNPIVAFNRGYDQVGEPWRLLGCLALCAPLCLLGYFPQYMVEILIYTAGLLGMRVWWTSRRPSRKLKLTRRGPKPAR